jgi:hypothetical protein
MIVRLNCAWNDLPKGSVGIVRAKIDHETSQVSFRGYLTTVRNDCIEEVAGIRFEAVEPSFELLSGEEPVYILRFSLNQEPTLLQVTHIQFDYHCNTWEVLYEDGGADVPYNGTLWRLFYDTRG